MTQNYLSGDSSVNIAASVESAVFAGKLPSGSLLPPVRTLAAELRVSPATVAAAYRLLRDRGVVIADGRRGTRVRPAPPRPQARRGAAGRPPAAGRRCGHRGRARRHTRTAGAAALAAARRAAAQRGARSLR